MVPVALVDVDAGEDDVLDVRAEDFVVECVGEAGGEGVGV